jgi:hypothetical protein
MQLKLKPGTASEHLIESHHELKSYELADTYVAQFAAAWNAGRSDPEIDAYYDYELNEIDRSSSP